MLDIDLLVKSPRVSVHRMRAHIATLIEALHGFLDDPLQDSDGEDDGVEEAWRGWIENGAVQAIYNGREKAVRGWLVEPDLMGLLMGMVMTRPVRRSRIEVGWSCALHHQLAPEPEQGAVPIPFWLVARCKERGQQAMRLKDRTLLEQATFDVWIDGQRDTFTVREDGEVTGMKAELWTPDRQVLLVKMIAQVRDGFAFEKQEAAKAQRERGEA